MVMRLCFDRMFFFFPLISVTFFDSIIFAFFYLEFFSLTTAIASMYSNIFYKEIIRHNTVSCIVI